MSGENLVTPRVKEMFLRHGIRRSFAAGEVLFEKGTPAQRVGFIASGQARTYCLNPPGKRSSSSILGRIISSAPRL